MMSDINDMVKYHDYQMGELLNLTPFDYQIIKLMIIDSIQKEMDHKNG